MNKCTIDSKERTFSRVNLLFSVDFPRNYEANLETNHENDHQREVDEIILDFLYQELCRDKHHFVEDIWLLLHPHFHRLFDIQMLDRDVLDKIAVEILD